MHRDLPLAGRARNDCGAGDAPLGDPARHERLAESKLVTQALGGDEDAFATVYRRYLPVVVRWSLREMRDAELTADLAAEVFAQALVSAAHYKPRRGSLIAWLLGIARNKLHESRRRGYIESSARRRLGVETLTITDADLERVEELASLDEEILERVASLPEEQRTALLDRIVQERSYEQIADDLRCSQAVVRQRVSRGLKTLRAQVKEP
jgi:RNA polymerase sigma factor (sigma-70 family)